MHRRGGRLPTTFSSLDLPGFEVGRRVLGREGCGGGPGGGWTAWRTLTCSCVVASKALWVTTMRGDKPPEVTASNAATKPGSSDGGPKTSTTGPPAHSALP
eukprot:357392-Chlamydomonas_euryale.AAC.17